MDARFIKERLEDAKRWLEEGQRGDPNGAIAYQASKGVKDALSQVEEQNQNWIKKHKTIRNSAIERCAQVAENFNAAGKPIAAAIRKLKKTA